MGDAIEFLFNIATPVEKITLMRQRMTRYCNPNFSTCSLVKRKQKKMRGRYSDWHLHIAF